MDSIFRCDAPFIVLVTIKLSKMALFQRVTKTRVSGATGTVTFFKFFNSQKEESLSIHLVDEKGKKHSITLYGPELKALENVCNQPPSE